MPIENERKYVLYDPNGKLENQLNLLYFDKQEITQIYLNNSNRIRKIITKKDVKYYHTFKYKTKNNVTIELESKIHHKDYELLVSDEPQIFLNKIRYKRKEHDVLWDIDFLKYDFKTYFVLAEAEFDDPERYDVELLSILKPFLLHVVDKESKKYTNYKLCDREYAEKLMQELLIK